MNNLISKELFCNMFRLKKDFTREKRYNFAVPVSLIHDYMYISGVFHFGVFNGIDDFDKKLTKIGFIRHESPDENFWKEYRFYIADEYISYVQNIFDLIKSDDVDQTHLAFQLFQNIKLYKKDGKANEITDK